MALKERTRQRRMETSGPTRTDGEGRRVGRVSPYNGPLREHVTFSLATHGHVQQQLRDIINTDAEQRRSAARCYFLMY